MEEKVAQKVHKIMMTNRRGLTLTGIVDVLSFDVGEILLETEQGMLLIKGNDMHVNRLTLEKGEMEIDGRVDSMAYSDIANSAKQAEGFWGRLFK